MAIQTDVTWANKWSDDISIVTYIEEAVSTGKTNSVEAVSFPTAGGPPAPVIRNWNTEAAANEFVAFLNGLAVPPTSATVVVV